MSVIRQNYSEACEALVNKQINMELYASYVYQSMVRYSYSLTKNSLSFWFLLFAFEIFVVLRTEEFKTRNWHGMDEIPPYIPNGIP